MTLKILSIIILFSFSNVGFSQVVRLKTKPGRLFIKKNKLKRAPNLVVTSIRVHDHNNNGIIESNEPGHIEFIIKNVGRGKAKNVRVLLSSPKNDNKFSYNKKAFFKTLPPRKHRRVKMKIRGKVFLQQETSYLILNVRSALGFSTDPIPIAISTAPTLKPKPEISLISYRVKSGNGSNLIHKKEAFKVELTVKNKSRISAKKVNASIKVPYGIFILSSGGNKVALNALRPSESKTFSFTLITGENYKKQSLSITLNIDVDGKLTRSSKVINIPLSSSRAIQQKLTTFNPLKIPNETDPPYFKSFPKGMQKRPNAVAIIIAISDYQNNNIPSVKYAKRDAKAMRSFLIHTMGYDPKNILPKDENEIMTAGQMKTLVRRIAPAYLKPNGNSELFVYYVGHGAPNTETQRAFLVPYDSDPNFINDDNGYAAEDFYSDIANLNASHKTIIVDACFSGTSQEGRMLIQNASPVFLKVKNPLIAQEGVRLFQSSTSNQVSNWFPEKKHSMFTYFFLNGVSSHSADSNSDGKITVGELENYINNSNDGMPYWSKREFNRTQNAVISGDRNSILVKLSNRD